MTVEKERVLVAMSGGVDSSVAAGLLLESGYQVIGATLQLQDCHESTSRSCCGADEAAQARMAAGRLGIPHYVLDCRREFDEIVLRYSWAEYDRGRTPNPCVLCNKRIKFGLLAEFAARLGADRVATGHYVRTERDADGRLAMLRGKDLRKDQSYFLFSLSSKQLESALFPLGLLTKPQVREEAHRMGLQNADNQESQDACLASVGEAFSEILRQRFGQSARTGSVVDDEGNVLGAHGGVHLYTVGQRRGLGISLGEKTWVKAIDSERARVVLTNDERKLFSRQLIATGVNWLAPVEDCMPIRCRAQVRYRQASVTVQIEMLGDRTVRVLFDQPIRAVAPGQAVVFYQEDRLLGGGWIETSSG
ncbi:MAG: tRNA 2-thiouridine(34) synthase MnmA [Syntrophobacteraceae bacterium]